MKYDIRCHVDRCPNCKKMTDVSTGKCEHCDEEV